MRMISSSDCSASIQERAPRRTPGDKLLGNASQSKVPRYNPDRGVASGRRAGGGNIRRDPRVFNVLGDVNHLVP